MTTMKEIHTEGIYLKGVPLTDPTDQIVNINAVIAGLTGGQPSPGITPEPIIQTRAPTSTDDISENWEVGSIWISDQGYVCLDNREGKAVWKVCSLEIRDDENSKTKTYSSQKIEFLLFEQLTQTDNKLSLKADKTDVYTITDLDIELGKIIEKVSNTSFAYTNNKVGLVTTDLNNYKEIIQITVNQIEAALNANMTNLTNYKEIIQITINDIEGAIGANATGLNNYKITMQNTIDDINAAIGSNSLALLDFKTTTLNTIDDINAAIEADKLTLKDYRAIMRDKVDEIYAEIAKNTSRILALENATASTSSKVNNDFYTKAEVDALFDPSTITDPRNPQPPVATI